MSRDLQPTGHKEDSIRFAGLMEDYLNIPSFVCEMIQQQLEENKYKEIVEYVIQRRNEIESKPEFISDRNAITMLVNQNEEKDKEIDRLKREVAKLHIIQEEYGNHIENTHIIDDYQKTYFMSNKWLIELKNGKFVYIDELNDKYEDYKSRNEKAIELLKEAGCYDEETKTFCNDIWEELPKLLNILNCGDDNE